MPLYLDFMNLKIYIEIIFLIFLNIVDCILRRSCFSSLFFLRCYRHLLVDSYVVRYYGWSMAPNNVVNIRQLILFFYGIIVNEVLFRFHLFSSEQNFSLPTNRIWNTVTNSKIVCMTKFIAFVLIFDFKVLPSILNWTEFPSRNTGNNITILLFLSLALNFHPKQIIRQIISG